MTDLFSPARFGAIELANRVVMSSLTRNRAAVITSYWLFPFLVLSYWFL